jgi:hypothetical protein
MQSTVLKDISYSVTENFRFYVMFLVKVRNFNSLAVIIPETLPLYRSCYDTLLLAVILTRSDPTRFESKSMRIVCVPKRYTHVLFAQPRRVSLVYIAPILLCKIRESWLIVSKDSLQRCWNFPKGSHFGCFTQYTIVEATILPSLADFEGAIISLA